MPSCVCVRACLRACACAFPCVCLHAWSAQRTDPESGRARLEFKGEQAVALSPNKSKCPGCALSSAGLAADLGVKFGGLVGMLDELARIESEKLRARIGLC
jgi:hypothetical protein